MEHAVEATMNILEDHERTITLSHLRAALPLMRFDGRGHVRLKTMMGVSGQPAPPPPADRYDDDAQEAEQLAETLLKTKGNVARAARLLGFSPQKLHYRLKRLGLNSAEYKR
jgi:arginine utilization regulatory protein